jgi:serine/threonine protein kinase
VRILLLVAETIHHAHGRNVVHRDIKPENILLTYDQSNETWLPYLTDFDLAWFSTATKLTKEGMGNVYYAAPEQLASPHSRAAHEVTVDVFSFGQLGFFVLTGSDPAPLGRADNSRALSSRLEQWPVGQAANQYLAWYERCTADQPAERYQDFQILIDELSKIELSLRETAPTSRLSRSDFLGEIAFALSGFTGVVPNTIEPAFPSLSGRAQIVLRTAGERESGDDLLLDLDVRLSLERITIEGVYNERARTIYNNRIDEILRGFDSVRRRPGTHGVFAVHILFANVASSLMGVDHVRQVLSRVIDAIER